MKKFVCLFLLIIPLLTFGQIKDIEEEYFNDDGKLFKGFVVAGFNLTQIDGDALAGFNHIGVNAGGGVFIAYSKKFSNSVEINYSMKGANSTLVKPTATTGFISYQMDYIEVPVLFNYHDFKIAIFQAGLSYTNVIRTHFEVNNSVTTADFYPWNIDLIAGFTFLIKKKWGINFKYNYSILNNLVINNEDRGSFIGDQSIEFSKGANANRSWFHNTLTFRAMYIF